MIPLDGTGTDNRSDPALSFDWTMEDRPSRSVVSAVAAFTNTDAVELPVLYESVDADSLDAFIEHVDHGHVEFYYQGFRIRLEATGSGYVYETNSTR